MMITDHEHAVGLIRQAMEVYPFLNPSGLEVPIEREVRRDLALVQKIITERRDEMLQPYYVCQYIRAYAYMSEVPRVQKVNPRAPGSYGLKHCAENCWYKWLEDHGYKRNGYIANGMLIAACHSLGFLIRGHGINADFNISRKLPERLDFTDWYSVACSA